MSNYNNNNNNTNQYSLLETALCERRRELYPTLYDNDLEVMEAVHAYGVEVPHSSTTTLFHKQPSLPISNNTQDDPNNDDDEDGKEDDENDDDEEEEEEDDDDDFVPDETHDVSPKATPSAPPSTAPSTNTVPTSSTLNNNTTLQRDIYGRLVSKEPKQLVVCLQCSRPVSGLRFAPHLDKCMGLGVGSRLTSNNNNNSNQQAK